MLDAGGWSVVSGSWLLVDGRGLLATDNRCDRLSIMLLHNRIANDNQLCHWAEVLPCPAICSRRVIVRAKESDANTRECEANGR
jgi:hypothetical protein